MSLVGGLGDAVLEDRVAAGDRRSRLLGIRMRFGEPVNERLRHEVFDAATVVDGTAETADGDDRAIDTSNDAVGRLETTVDAITGHWGGNERSRLGPPHYVGVRSRGGLLPAGSAYHLLQY